MRKILEGLRLAASQDVVKGRLTEALSKYSKIISQAKSMPPAEQDNKLMADLYFQKGSVLERLGMPERKQALDDFAQAAKLDPDNFQIKEAYKNLSESYEFIDPSRLVFPDEQTTDEDEIDKILKP